jgi:hypothetical protein
LEKQNPRLMVWDSQFMWFLEEKLKRNVDFVAKFMGLPMPDFVKYPNWLTFNLEKRIIPRSKVMEELTSMQMQELKRETTFT